MTASLPLLDEETRLQKPQFKTIMFRTVAADGAMMEAYHRAVERWEQRQRSALTVRTRDCAPNVCGSDCSMIAGF